MKNIIQTFQSSYLYDARKLSIGRIVIALIICVDLIMRWTNFEAHYTNQGVLPVKIIQEYYPAYQYYFSLHNLLNDDVFQIILFIIHFIIALALLVGFRTKISLIFNYIFLLSLHKRNPLILQGGDDLLRITLFYMIFLPCHTYYSIDALKYHVSTRKKTMSFNGFSWMYVLFSINVAFVYLFSALLKTSDEWRYSGEAIYYALSLDTLRTSVGDILYPHHTLLKVVTYIVYYVLEIIAPLLIIFSFSISIRYISVTGIIVLHLFILTTLKVGIFPFVGIATAWMLLPSTQSVKIHNMSFQYEWLIAIILFILIIRFNLATLHNPYFSISTAEDRIMNAIGLAQRWNMFSPAVKKYDGWLVLRGIKKDNSEWDLIFHSPVIHFNYTHKHKEYLVGDRWRKFLENYEQRQYNFVKPYFCYHLISQWNKNHPENPIEALNILYVKKETLPHYQYKTEVENLCLCNPSIEKP